jgi:hypothetical protein
MGPVWIGNSFVNTGIILAKLIVEQARGHLSHRFTRARAARPTRHKRRLLDDISECLRIYVMSGTTNCAAGARENLSTFLEESAEQDDQDLTEALWFQMILLARL